MATFVVLAKWTEKSLTAFKDAPGAAEEFKKAAAAMGVQIKGWYVLMGQYDEMCIFDAPNAETVAKLILPFREKYGGQTETLQAFSEAEAMGLFAGLK
ncbi:MAG: GYD domain-containing protein [Thermodesulfobacteriota bacterium]